MSEEFVVSDFMKSKIIRNEDNVKIYCKNKLLYDGPYKDVHIIGMSSGNMFSSEKISFGFPGKVFQMDFYPQNKEDSMRLKQVFSDKVREHEQSEEYFKEKYKIEKQERKDQRKREILQQQENTYKKGGIFTKIKCPRCWSIEIQVVDTKKKFSFGKAIVGNTVGGVLGGPVGAFIGAGAGIQGKNGKTKFVCCNCGKVWEQKV